MEKINVHFTLRYGMVLTESHLKMIKNEVFNVMVKRYLVDILEIGLQI